MEKEIIRKWYLKLNNAWFIENLIFNQGTLVTKLIPILYNLIEFKSECYKPIEKKTANDQTLSNEKHKMSYFDIVNRIQFTHSQAYDI